MIDYVSAAVLIFFAEMGDKTQFLAMAFATRYDTKKILMGVALGSFLNHGLAMILGKGLLTVMPRSAINFAAGLMFLFFAFQSLKVEGDALEENKSKFGPVLTVGLAFFIGELGDKTQLAALGLAIDSSSIILSLLGTVTGMVLTSAIGIFVGLKLGRKVPQDKLKVSAFAIFIVFACQKLYTSYFKNLPTGVVLLGLVVLAFCIYRAYKKFTAAYSQLRETGFSLQAEALKNTRDQVSLKVDDLCKGQEKCGVCEGGDCLVGRMKMLLRQEEGPLSVKALKDLSQLKSKAFSTKEAQEIFLELLAYYDKYPHEFLDNTLFKEVRKSVEIIMFGHMIHQEHYKAYKAEVEGKLGL